MKPRWYWYWFQAWIELVCAIVSILTLSCYRPWWDFKYITWLARRSMKEKG